MAAAAWISNAAGLISEADRVRVEALLCSFGLPVRRDDLASYETLAPYIAGDKKVAASRVRWVLLSGVGSTVIRSDVPEETVRRAIDSLR